MIGKTEEELVHEAEDEARTALARESVLAAVVEDEQIEVTDDEVLDALRAAAAAQSPDRAPSEKQLRRSLDRARSEGRADMLREDIAMRKAVDVLVESGAADPRPSRPRHARALDAGQGGAGRRQADLDPGELTCAFRA